MTELSFNLEGNNTDFIRKAQELRNGIEELSRVTIEQSMKIDDAFNEISLETLGKFKEILYSLPEGVRELEPIKQQIIGLEKNLREVTKVIAELYDKTNTPIATNSDDIVSEVSAYNQLINSIGDALKVREQTISLMFQEQNAIRLNQKELKILGEIENSEILLSESQQMRRSQLTNSVMQHQQAVNSLQQILEKEIEIESVVRASMDEMGKSLERVRVSYEQLSESEQTSQFGQDLLDNIQEADTKIKQLDETIGNYQQNLAVGGDSWGNLNISIQQLGQGLPSISDGVKTFFSAISNSVPILIDELEKAKLKNEEFKKSGKETIPVWKQVASSLLSWQTALSVGVTLLTLYGDKIVDWASTLFTTKKALSETYQSLEDYQKAVGDSSGSVIGTLEQLSNGWNQLGDDVNAKKKYILDNKEAIDSMGVSVTNVAEAESLFNANKDAFILSILQRAKAAATMELAAEQYKKGVQKMMEADSIKAKGVTFSDKLKSFFAKSAAGEDLSGSLVNADLSPEAFVKSAEESKRKEAESFFTSGDELVKEYTKLSENANEGLKNINLKTTRILVEGSIGAIETAISLKQRALKEVTNNKEFVRINAEIMVEQAKLNAITGGKNKVDKKSYIDSFAQTREIEKSSQSIKDALFKSEIDIQQQQIELMDSGSDKQLAQIRLNYDKRYQEIQKEERELLQKMQDDERKQWEKENPDFKKKNLQFTPTITALPQEQSTQFDKEYSLAYQKQVKDEQSLLDQLLVKYQDYDAQRIAIEKQGNEEIAFLQSQRTDANAEEIDRAIEVANDRMRESLSDMDIEINKKTATFSLLFSEMKDRSVKDMRSIANEAQKALEYVEAGEFQTDENGKGIFGISEETFVTLQKSPDKIEQIKKGIKGVNEEADQCDTAINMIASGFGKLLNAGSDPKAVTEALAEIETGLNKVIQAGQILSNALSGLGDSFGNETMGKVAEGMNVAMDAASATMSGAQAGMAFGPWGAAAGAAIGLVSSLGSSLAKLHDAKKEKNIQRIQEQIEVLEKSYEKLGESIDKSYSSDASKLIEQQNTLLEQQKVLIQNQIAEEKGKKKADNGRIKDWENQIEEINKAIAEGKEKAIDVLLGEDVKAAIDNFAQAYADAWAAGDDRAKSSKDLVKSMIKQMIMEAMKATTSAPMEKLRQKLAGYFSDGIISAWEREQIEKDAEAIANELDDKYGWADEYMKGDSESTSQESSKGGFESMSQETGSELNGRFAALQVANEEMRNSMQSVVINLSSLHSSVTDGNLTLTEMRNLAVMSNSYLQDIAGYTKRILVDFGGKLDNIITNTKGL